jgi:hypothetical protein
MRTLYLPTSSLNFNAIFSMEEVSPAHLYGAREFGYKRWEKTAPNPFAKSLLLYDKIPVFEVQDTETENMPIVVAIDRDETPAIQEVARRKGVTVYRQNTSIYITPYNTKVFFRSADERRRVLAGAARSIETKLVRVYEKEGCYRIKTNQPDFVWDPEMIEGVKDDPPEDITRILKTERRIDQLKGFMYAYALGAWTSMPEETSELLRISRTIRNTVTSMSGSLDDAPKAQWDKLLQTIIEFECAFEKADEASRTYFEARSIQHQKDGIEGLFADIQTARGAAGYLRFITDWKREAKLYTAGAIFDLLQTLRGSSASAKAETALKQLEAVVANTTKREKLRSTGTETGYPDFLLDGELLLRCIKDDERDLQPKGEEAARAIVNGMLENRYTVRNLVEDRLGVARACGLAIKAVMEPDKWEGSQTERYVNGLLKNVGRQEPFDVQSTTSNFLRSFAAFILKGDDLEKLQDFAVSNRAGGFRIAFGLHGALAGFTALPKTVLEPLYAHEDPSVLDNLYKKIHVALHGACPVGRMTGKNQDPETITSSEPPETAQPENKPIASILETLKNQKRITKKVFDEFKQRWLPHILAGQEYHQELTTWIKETKAPKAVILTCVDQLTQTRHIQRERNPEPPVAVEQMLLLQEGKTGKSAGTAPQTTFVEDRDCGRAMVADDDELSQLKQETRHLLAAAIVMFQKKYEPGGFYATRPQEYLRDNENTMDHFMRCLSSKLPRAREMNVPLTDSERRLVVTWLAKRYGR